MLRNPIAAFVLVGGLVVGALYASIGQWSVAAVFMLTGVGVFALLIASEQTSTSHQHLLDLPPENRRVVVYWQPAHLSGLWLRLRMLRVHAGIIWINVRTDPEARVYLRGLHADSADVPVAVVDGHALTHPTTAQIMASLTTR